MSFSSNLLKRSWVQLQSDEARVINNNELVERRLRGGEADGGFRSGAGAETGEAQEPGVFYGGLHAAQLSSDELSGLLNDPNEESAVPRTQPEAPEIPPQPVYDGPSPEELIQEAQEEISRMRSEAQKEMEALKKQAEERGRQEGKDQGYRDGKAAAQAELDAAKRQLNADYEKKLQEMEPEMVRQLTGIYEHIFHVELGAYQGLVMQLLESCMQKTEGSSNYIVHVGPDDYPFVSMQKNRLTEAMGNKNASLEVVEDATMKKNECMIEADGGIYDCSLDVQLEALRRQLILLSYEGS
ncbi:MAG: hypothetical protein J6C33_07905 [Lachnospiraceae bacterium]|nr:hypothetical protein [Lachnospiraceae bacterium]